MAQARVDRSEDKTFRSFLAPGLLILDDLGLHRLDHQQSIDLYELVIARLRTASFVITSIRAVEEWLGLFDDPILGNRALDRGANASFRSSWTARAIANGSRRTELCSNRRRWLTRQPHTDVLPSTGLQHAPMTLAMTGLKTLANGNIIE